MKTSFHVLDYALQMPVSPSCEDAIAAEVRRHLGTADGKHGRNSDTRRSPLLY